MSKGLEKSLWDVAIQESNEIKAEGATGEESSVFIVGAKKFRKDIHSSSFLGQR